MTTTYERIGGAGGIARLVHAFYDRVLADPELAPFFTHVSMDHLRAMQSELFTAATGGPVERASMSVRDAHAGRHITERQFSLFANHVMTTLQDFGLEDEDVSLIADHLALYRDEVVDSPGNPD